MRECVSWGLQQRQAGLFTAVATMSGKQHVYLLWVEDANDVEISVFLPVPALPRCTSLFVTAVSLLPLVALHCSCAHSCLSSAPITKDLLNRRLLCPPCTAAEITGASIRTVSLNIPPPLFTRAIAGRWTTCWTSNRMSSRYSVVAHAILCSLIVWLAPLLALAVFLLLLLNLDASRHLQTRIYEFFGIFVGCMSFWCAPSSLHRLTCRTPHFSSQFNRKNEQRSCQSIVP